MWKRRGGVLSLKKGGWRKPFSTSALYNLYNSAHFLRQHQWLPKERLHRHLLPPGKAQLQAQLHLGHGQRTSRRKQRRHYRPPDSIARMVLMAVIILSTARSTLVKLAFFTVAMITFPIGTYFISVDRYFDGMQPSNSIVNDSSKLFVAHSGFALVFA
jgi:hypothetical protein